MEADDNNDDDDVEEGDGKESADKRTFPVRGRVAAVAVAVAADEVVLVFHWCCV